MLQNLTKARCFRRIKCPNEASIILLWHNTPNQLHGSPMLSLSASATQSLKGSWSMRNSCPHAIHLYTVSILSGWEFITTIRCTLWMNGKSGAFLQTGHCTMSHTLGLSFNSEHSSQLIRDLSWRTDFSSKLNLRRVLNWRKHQQEK